LVLIALVWLPLYNTLVPVTEALVAAHLGTGQPFYQQVMCDIARLTKQKKLKISGSFWRGSKSAIFG